MNNGRSCDIKNMYLKKSDNYIFIKARTKNYFMYTVCKNLGISIGEFCNRLNKIKQEDFNLIRLRTSVSYENI